MATKPKPYQPMSPEELRQIATDYRMLPAEMAHFLGVTRRQYDRYIHRATPIPTATARLLRLMSRDGIPPGRCP
jgi:DNA-binding transcriptional regulator YiaG